MKKRHLNSIQGASELIQNVLDGANTHQTALNIADGELELLVQLRKQNKIVTHIQIV